MSKTDEESVIEILSDDDDVTVTTIPNNTTRQLAKKSTSTPYAGAKHDFVKHFLPQTHVRRKRRNVWRSARKSRAAVYDDAGVHIESGKDACDCLEESCPGCHFPCPKCSSNKCGVHCRVNRTFVYKNAKYYTDYLSVEYENIQ